MTEKKRTRNLTLISPVGLLFAALCFTYLVYVDGTIIQWVAFVFLWLAAIVSWAGYVLGKHS